MQMESLLYFEDIDVSWIPLLTKRLAKWRHLQQSKSSPSCKKTDTRVEYIWRNCCPQLIKKQ